MESKKNTFPLKSTLFLITLNVGKESRAPSAPLSYVPGLYIILIKDKNTLYEQELYSCAKLEAFYKLYVLIMHSLFQTTFMLHYFADVISQKQSRD